MNKNTLKITQKYKNVVDLHDRDILFKHKQNLVDLRSPHRSSKDSFENTLSKKLYQDQDTGHVSRPAVRKNVLSSLYKTIAILLVVTLNSFMLGSVGSTFSVLNDIEASTDNLLESGVLDFELTISPFSNDAWQNLIEGTSTARDIDVEPNVLSNPFFYYASSTNFVGDQAFCNAVQVVATLDGDLMYDGPLVDLFSPTTTNISVWNFEFTNDVKFFNSVCQFDIDFNGWQTRHDYPQYHDGFSDTERTTHILFSDGLKINKVYFEAPMSTCRHDMDDHYLGEDDPRHDRTDRGERQDRREIWPHPDRDCYDDRGRENSPRNNGTTTDESNATSTNATSTPHFEWVELYNPNNEPADIDGWFLCDGQECDVLNAPDPIPPLGFAIVVTDYSDLNGWITPSDFVIILVDDEAIGDGLDNENDALFLRRPDFFTFDQVNWGIPDPLWPYYDVSLWNPGVASTTDGTMMARIPTGFDTNQPSDFQILGIPWTNLLYPGDVVNEKWFWGFTYLVTWETFNPNGPEDDLLIDIWMIRDTNHSGNVDGGDEHILLHSKIDNDGNEEVTVPEGFLGTIWIKIVATGPENPMSHGFDFSGPIDDPIPTHMLDNEDDMDVMRQAVIDQINGTGESEFAHLLIDPIHLRPLEQSTSTTTSSEETIEEEEEVVEEMALTTEQTIEAPEQVEVVASSSEPVIEEEIASSTATTTPEVAEEKPTFEEEITELIEEFIEEHAPTTTEEVMPTEESEEEEDVEIVTSTEEAMLPEEIETATTTEEVHEE